MYEPEPKPTNQDEAEPEVLTPEAQATGTIGFGAPTPHARMVASPQRKLERLMEYLLPQMEGGAMAPAPRVRGAKGFPTPTAPIPTGREFPMSFEPRDRAAARLGREAWGQYNDVYGERPEGAIPAVPGYYETHIPVGMDLNRWAQHIASAMLAERSRQMRGRTQLGPGLHFGADLYDPTEGVEA